MERVLRRMARGVWGLALAVGSMASGPARADDDDKPATVAAASAIEDDGFEVENAFGNTEGAGLNQKGEWEFGSTLQGRFGKRRGSYRAFSSESELEYGLDDRISVGFAAFTAGHRIRNVPGLDDRSAFGFDGLAVGTKLGLLERDVDGPIGLSLTSELEWHRTDETSGERSRSLGNETKLIAEAALVPNMLYVAANIGFEAERSKQPGEPEETESTLFASAALSWRFQPRALVGAEVRFENAYEGLFKDRVGSALFVGPTAFVKLPNKFTLSAAWSTQVWGDGHGGRNLRDFEQNRIMVRLNKEF